MSEGIVRFDCGIVDRNSRKLLLPLGTAFAGERHPRYALQVLIALQIRVAFNPPIRRDDLNRTG
jgi:hypothetical protein